MTDVLIVCVREDEVQAKALADLFEREGMSVGGAPADDSALRSSGAIVVIWSQASIRSRPFLDASQRVVNAGKAVFACLIDPPPASSLNQSPWFDLKRWDGSPDDPTVDPLFFAVDRMVNANGGGYAPAPEPGYQAPQFESRGYSQQSSPPPYARARPLAPAPAPRYEPPPQPSARRAERAEHADPASAEALRWKAIRHSRDPTAFLNYLTEYGPDGAFSELAELRLKQLQDANTTPLKAAARAVETQARRPAAAPPPPRREAPLVREREPEPERAYAAPPTYAPPVREYRDYAPPPERRSAGGGAMRFVILFALLGAGAIGAGMYFGTGQQLSPETPAYAAQEEPTPGEDVAELSAPLPAAPSASAVGGPTELEESAFDAAPRAPASRATAAARETIARDDPRNAAAAPRFEPLGPQPAAPSVSLMPQPVAPAPQQMAALSTPAPAPIARRGVVVWQTRASAAQFSAVYPQNARRADVSGRVQLSCVIQADYSAACAVASESPAGYGFGQAALRVARSYRARPTLDDGTPSPGSDARLNISFQAAE